MPEIGVRIFLEGEQKPTSKLPEGPKHTSLCGKQIAIMYVENEVKPGMLCLSYPKRDYIRMSLAWYVILIGFPLRSSTSYVHVPTFRLIRAGVHWRPNFALKFFAKLLC